MGFIFWFAIAVPFYAYIGYPLVLVLLRLMIHCGVQKAPIEPFVSLLIPAYNEGDVIEKKIHNSLALDYPAERIEVVVASDGSKDNTVEVARRFEDGARVRVIAYPANYHAHIDEMKTGTGLISIHDFVIAVLSLAGVTVIGIVAIGDARALRIEDPPPAPRPDPDPPPPG